VSSLCVDLLVSVSVKQLAIWTTASGVNYRLLARERVVDKLECTCIFQFLK